MASQTSATSSATDAVAASIVTRTTRGPEGEEPLRESGGDSLIVERPRVGPLLRFGFFDPASHLEFAHFVLPGMEHPFVFGRDGGLSRVRRNVNPGWSIFHHI